MFATALEPLQERYLVCFELIIAIVVIERVEAGTGGAFGVGLEASMC